MSQCVSSPEVFPLNSSARRIRPAAATAGISCSRTQRASLSHAADSSSRRHPRERKKERERESRGVSVLYRPYDVGASIASASYGLLARAAVKKAADRRIRVLQSGARTRSRHSVVYRRVTCVARFALRSFFTAAIRGLTESRVPTSVTAPGPAEACAAVFPRLHRRAERRVGCERERERELACYSIAWPRFVSHYYFPPSFPPRVCVRVRVECRAIDSYPRRSFSSS